MPTRNRQKKNGTAGLVGRWLITIMLFAVLGGLIALGIWAAGSLLTDRQETELQLPQQVQLNSVILADTELLRPEDFVSGLEGTEISVTFDQQPQSGVGKQIVVLNFSKGNASCTQRTTLQIFHLEKTVTGLISQTEEPSAPAPGIRDFIADTTLEAEFVGKTPEQVDRDQCGDHKLVIRCGGREYEVVYRLEERIAPQATAVSVTTATGKLPDPATLVTDIVDHSKVTVSYQQEPKLNIVGAVEVTLVLTDAYGNTATVNSVIHVVPGENDPQFEGVNDLYVRLGNTISYKEGVKAVDAQDGEILFTVDASAVDQAAEGTYTVYYSATDADGNTTVVPRKIIVESADRAAVEAYAQAVLQKIITDSMSLDQKIRAVYSYTRHKVLYIGTSDKTSILHAAYEGFSTGKGDCYTYYAMNCVMFDMLGITHLEVTRIGGTSHHWWNLVLFEDGLYYHVDSTPTAVSREDVFHGKMTDHDLVVYTNDPGVINRRPNFYVYDKTLPEYEGIEIAP